MPNRRLLTRRSSGQAICESYACVTHFLLHVCIYQRAKDLQDCARQGLQDHTCITPIVWLMTQTVWMTIGVWLEMCDTGNRRDWRARAVILGCMMSLEGSWGSKWVCGWDGYGADTAGASFSTIPRKCNDSNGVGVIGHNSSFWALRDYVPSRLSPFAIPPKAISGNRIFSSLLLTSFNSPQWPRSYVVHKSCSATIALRFAYIHPCTWLLFTLSIPLFHPLHGITTNSPVMINLTFLSLSVCISFILFWRGVDDLARMYFWPPFFLGIPFPLIPRLEEVSYPPISYPALIDTACFEGVYICSRGRFGCFNGVIESSICFFSWIYSTIGEVPLFVVLVYSETIPHGSTVRTHAHWRDHKLRILEYHFWVLLDYDTHRCVWTCFSSARDRVTKVLWHCFILCTLVVECKGGPIHKYGDNTCFSLFITWWGDQLFIKRLHTKARRLMTLVWLIGTGAPRSTSTTSKGVMSIYK